ncbi:MAG: acylphosphatase [Gemmatimonadetes bacterium]|nr:acylphosphatase [Gemmatimonadota bacterium]
MSSVVRRRFVVTGRVQCVGFRYFVQARASEGGLSGWVRNLPDGRVELEAQGAPEKVDQLEIALNAGPQLSRVDNVTAVECPVGEDKGRFCITH